MEDMKRLKKMLCEELEEQTDRGITMSNLDSIYKMVVAIEKIHKIEEMEGNQESGRSYRSYESGRNDSYSRRSRARSAMSQAVDDLMEDPSTPMRDKEALSRAMDILNR